MNLNAAIANQYLTFTLADEQYAMAIEKVKEVLDLVPITHVPRMPAFLRGVINLRGNVVPVVDLRLCLDLPSSERGIDSCIVIVELTFGDEKLSVGMLADSVQEVVDIDPSLIKPPAQLGMKLPTEFIQGMWMGEESLVIIIDIDRVMSAQEMLSLSGAVGE